MKLPYYDRNTIAGTVLKFMFVHASEWIQPKDIIIGVRSQFTTDKPNANSIAAILSKVYHDGMLELKQDSTIHKYKISRKGIDSIKNMPSEDQINSVKKYTSTHQISNVDDKIMDIFKTHPEFLSSWEVAHKLSLDPSRCAGGLSTKLSMFCDKGLLIKNHEHGAFQYKLNDVFNSLNKPVNSKNNPSKIIKSSDLERLVHELMDYGISRLDIQKICFDALQPKLSEIKNSKIDDELKYLEEKNFKIFDKYVNMQKEIEDLKEQLNQKEMTDMINRTKQDRQIKLEKTR